ncbi:Inner membrane protein, KefB/KefC family [hydrothermal vent metagenome]|uniref:Inner membrane protein, KefB/KefC family n=1 Tax=hydrothermal vent metagenome TaxID=652676 RepID=A0A3B1AC24_9ZZZZ
MHDEPLVYTLFLIFSGAALVATLALYARQALLVAYILLGVLLGPSVSGLVDDPLLIKDIGSVGIMFLLFLLGLNMPPAKLLPLLKEATWVTGSSSLAFALSGFVLAWLLGFTLLESVLIGVAVTFSSTIIGLKLLPDTVLHHRRTGEIIISILLVQDVIAIIVLLLLQATDSGSLPYGNLLLLAASLPAIFGLSYALARFVLMPLIARFDQIQEYIFLMAIGWCLGISQLAAGLGLSHEIGAFIAGVALATHPISLFISERLKPLRDFFLILFFFSIGAGFNIGMLGEIVIPALLLSALILLGKPLLFRFLLRRSGESSGRASEVGVRLGQISEFSLLIAVLALQQSVIGEQASYLIQLSTLITFMVSSYVIVRRYPTPIAVSDKLRRN